MSELLDLVNRVRAKDDLQPFTMDLDLTKAARLHATAMAQRQQLSHQFSGEPELGQRLAAASSRESATRGTAPMIGAVVFAYPGLASVPGSTDIGALGRRVLCHKAQPGVTTRRFA